MREKFKSIWATKPPWVTQALSYVAVLLVGIIIGYWMHKHPVPMAAIPDTTPISVQKGLEAVGHPVGVAEATSVSKEIVRRVETTEPDAEWTSNTQKESDTKASEVAEKDKADSVLKETTPATSTEPIKNKYYGIHYEKKAAIGVYADIDKDGSYGLHLRRDRVVVDVGKKYKDGSLTARAAWEAIKF